MPQQRPPRPVQPSPFNRNPGQALIDRALLPPTAPPIASPLGRSLQPVAPVFPQTQPRFAQPIEAPLLPVAPQRVVNPAQVGEPIDYAALAVGSQAEGEKGKNELPAAEGRTIHRDADTYTIFTDDNGKPEENSYFRFDKATGAITDISADVRRELSIPADARRFLAAAFLPFADADAREGSYRPAALEMPVAMINDIGSLLPDNPRSLINAEFMTPLREYAQGASDRTAAAARLNNENLGLGAPDNLYEVALDVAGSLAIPVKGLPRLPGTNAAGNLGRAARAGQVVSDVAFEALTPFRQTGIVPALSVGMPLGVGLTEAQDTLANTNYEGIGDALERATAPDPDPLDALPSDIRTMFDEGDDETKSAIIDLLAQGLGEGHLEIPPNETPDWRNAGAILAGAGASMLGLYSLTSRLKSLQLPANAATTPPPAAPPIAPGLFAQANPTFVPQPPQIVGRAPVLNSTSLSSRLIGGVAQGDQVLRDRIRARGGSEDLVNRLTRQTPQASSGIIGHSLVTGEFPNSAIPRMPLAPTLEAMSKDLTTGEWDALADGLAAKSALDDFNATGVQTSLVGATISDVQAIADAMDNNPRLSKYASIIQKHYEEALDYARENGYLSDDMFNEMRTARPHYVPLGKNSEAAQTGDTLLGRPRVSPLTRSTMDELMTRNMEELQGTPAGEVADPVRQLPLYVANIIRQVEQNNMRRDIIDLELANPTVDGAVKRIANGASAANDANVVTIRRNGLVENYIVEDKALFNAMQFNNHIARNIAIDMIALPNRIVQASLTGPLQPFFAGIVSPLFDVTGGALLRPRGYDLGLISEAANKLIPPVDNWLLPGRKGGLIKDTVRLAGDRLKALDPTQLIAPATGALRGGWDEFIGGLANGASEQIIRQDGILYRALGPQGIQRFRDTMALWYKKSITAQMDRAGAGTSGLMNVEEGVNAPSVLNDAAPTFAERASRRAMEDAIAGDPTAIKTLIQGGNGFIRRVGLTPLVRTYMSVMRLLGEGTRYQAFATNAPRAARSVEDAQMVGNQTRRLAGDMREHGSSDAVEQGKKLFLYANPAVQGLAQVGRQFFKDQPLTSLANLTGVTAAFVAMQYYSANDEETQDYIRGLTPEQQASRVVLAPDVFLPVEPNLRPLWGPLALTLNDISGLNEGAYDFNFANAINQMIDGDYSLSEQAELNVREGFLKPLMALNPLGGGNQVVNAAGAAVGVDMGMSKYAGEPSEIKSQEVSGFGGEGQLANDPLSARWMAVTEELLSANVTNFLRAAFDVYRALDNDVGAEEALKIGASRMMDQTVRKSGAVRGLLFGDYVAERSANTQNRALYFEKTKRIAEIINIFDVDYRNQARTSQQPTAEPRPNEAERVELEGTAMVPIMNITRQLQNQTEDARGRVRSLNEAIQDVKNQTRTTIEERNAAVNEYRDEIEELTSQMLEQIQAREGLIRQIIGDPSFTYQSFDPEKYRNMPWAPAPQEMELQ